MKEEITKIKLPSKFEDFNETRKNGFLKMKELKESGQKVAGIFCTYTPQEVIYAAGLIPVSLCATTEDSIKYAERDLPKNLCPLIKSSYGFAVSDTCPYFYFSDIVIGETTCDGKKKMYELMGDFKNVHVMQLPQNNHDELSLKLWTNEIYKLKRKLEETFDVEITDEKLWEAIKMGNQERRNLKNFFELGKLNPSPLSGVTMSGTQDAFGFNFNREEKNQSIVEKTKEVYEMWEKELKGKKSKRPRILITGCPVGGIREKILTKIEEAGADIVVYENCSGVREKLELIDETMDNPIDAIAKKYLGDTFDIHGGGQDLVFPHHENEIAQSKCAYHGNFANYWLHNGFIQINGDKMSKSLGNFFLLREILEKFSGNVVRLFILSTHYRKPINFSFENMEDTKKALQNIVKSMNKFENIVEKYKNEKIENVKNSEFSQKIDEFDKKFEEAMDEDMNTPQALATIFDQIRETNKFISTNESEFSTIYYEIKKSYDSLKAKIENVFGIAIEVENAVKEEEGENMELTKKLIELLIKLRSEARSEKNFKLSDEIRDELKALGVEIKDNKDGSTDYNLL